MQPGLIVFIVGIVVVALIIVSIYNSLVRKRNFFKNAYSQIEVQLNRRYDLIPNLVETAKGFMKHEQETLEKVIQARNQAHKISINVSNDPSNANNMQELMSAEKSLTSSLGSFMAIAESYPELKSNTTMNQLMEELSSTENKISFARQGFNDSVTVYNNACETFPSNLIAGQFGFLKATLLEIDEPKKREAIKVSF